MSDQQQLDAVVVGAGFGGIYQLYSLTKLGLSTQLIEKADDVGGTWYWNRYPGAMSDTESYIYRYSWDKEDLLSYPWPNRYVSQPEILDYLRHVVTKHRLRRHMKLGTEVVSAIWDDQILRWRIELSTGQVIKARYFITALGLLSRANYPDIPGIRTFEGRLCHSSAWHSDIVLKDKRVGVIGNGSTGVQIITEVAKDVKQLLSFQRHAQYTVPAGNKPVTKEYRTWVNDCYDQIWADVKKSATCFGFMESTTPFQSMSPEEQEQVFEERPMRLRVSSSEKKVAAIVKDPAKAAKLQPSDAYAKRPICDNGYYEQFNRDNVDVVNIRENPIVAITPQGIQLADGKVHELDVIIFATGFDAIDGSYNRIRIRGRNGISLKECWDPRGPTSLFGVAVPQFPNMMMVLGPQGPFTNNVPALEAHVELNTTLIKRAEALRAQCAKITIEASAEAEKCWIDRCEASAEGSLFKDTASWIFGNNVSGKTVALRFYFGGMRNYLSEVKAAIDDGFRGFSELG
ncbi:hypothetical protein NM208_g6964 [Fusarium decemcellulare]|uniref:Uncharacterized protein n=1 Tax=Fusarium decemcellulare TaxID=57161 RepID=A0ACC1SB61_9HYPO|nr:hypothetical protein NM208_g6964 [Fusarium decemcellulare]